MAGRNCRQWVAAASMIVDHLGIVCESVGMRLWGRVSGPMYGLELRGKWEHILLIGALAQWPYWIVVGHRLNFALTLAGVEMLRGFLMGEHGGRYWWGVVAVVVGFAVLPVDGLGLAIGTALSRCTLKNDIQNRVAYLGGAGIAVVSSGNWINGAGVVVGYLLHKMDLPEVVRIPKGVWRALYPVHLAILAIITMVLGAWRA